MFKKILLVLLALVALLAIVIATRPSDFRVERAKMILASPAAVFPHVNDLHLWQEWSPWAKLDPNAKTTFGGTTAGKDASMQWAGNSDIGEGTMTLTESKPNELVRFRLDFKKPLEGTNFADITLTPEGSSTRVAWSMSGKRNFVMKAVGLVIDCDKMIGDHFNQGLDDMAKIVETKKK